MEMDIKDIEEIFIRVKSQIKELATTEKSLKSISSSFLIEKNEFIIYFTWKKEEYNQYFSEREIFRKTISNYMKSNYFLLNITKSNSAKYVFSNRLLLNFKENDTRGEETETI